MSLIKDPCKTCLVRPCCIIRKEVVWHRCDCGPYEIYRIWKSLSRYCNHSEHLTQLMMDNNPRIKKLILK